MLGDQGLQEITYKTLEEKKSITFSKVTNGWLGITDKYWAATLIPDKTTQFAGALLVGESVGTVKTYQTDYLGNDRRPSRRARRHSNAARLFAGAKEVAVIDGYEKQHEHQPLRSADRLGLVLFHHQAAVLADRLVLPPGRQFRRRHPARHRADQARLLPARQQVLRLDGEDEGGAAADDGDPRALRRRQDEAAAGDDGALQEGEDQSARRLPADR